MSHPKRHYGWSSVYRVARNVARMATGVQWYPFQEAAAQRITRSVVDDEGAEIVLKVSRQAGKSRVVADVAFGLAVAKPLLGLDPLRIGVFAPKLEQSKLIFGRVKECFSANVRVRGESVRLMEQLGIEPQENNGVTFKTNLGSSITCQTASPEANIEGLTLDLIILDEAQNLTSRKISTAIYPMGASTNATRVLLGTPSYHKDYFYDADQRLRGTGDHFNIPWTRVVDEKRAAFERDGKVFHTRYEKYVNNEMRRLGPESDAFLTQYCVAPGTRILTADLRHIRADEVRPGMSLVGFDEGRTAMGGHRKFRVALVEDVGFIMRPCYRLVLEDGTAVVCSSEHQWLVSTAGRRTRWKATEDLLPSDRIYKVTGVWETDFSSGAGYLAGAFDGEGSLSKGGEPGSRPWTLCFGQNQNAMLDTVKEYLTQRGYTYRETKNDLASECRRLALLGGRAEIMRFLGEVRPRRLLSKFKVDDLGSIGRHDRKEGGFEHPRLVKKEFIGTRKVVAIRTDTRTFVAEGLASHNCIEWLLERGMFVSFEALVGRCGAAYDRVRSGLVFPGTQANHVPVYAGLDIAKTVDQTVLSIGSWHNPQTFQPDGFFHLYDWLELQGDNYEDQFDDLHEKLQKYGLGAVRCVTIDEQGRGAHMADKFRRNGYSVLGIVTTRKSNDEVFRPFLDAVPARHTFRFPMGRDYAGLETVRDLMLDRETRRFIGQLTNAVKEYHGEYLDLHNSPDAEDPHDDYLDSAALMLYGALMWRWGGGVGKVGQHQMESFTLFDDPGSIPDLQRASRARQLPFDSPPGRKVI